MDLAVTGTSRAAVDAKVQVRGGAYGVARVADVAQHGVDADGLTFMNIGPVV